MNLDLFGAEDAVCFLQREKRNYDSARMNAMPWLASRYVQTVVRRVQTFEINAGETTLNLVLSINVS